MSLLSNTFNWQGRVDKEDGVDGLRWHQKVSARPQAPGVGLVGFACDLGVRANRGRPGAKDGPDHIRRALGNLAWHGRGGLQDFGNIVARDSLDAATQQYSLRVQQCLEAQHFAIGLGGGHEIAWGSYLGLRAQTPATRRIGIVNIDAHLDLRQPAPLPSSGTAFYQIAEDCRRRQQDFHYLCLGLSEASNTQALMQRARALGVTVLRDRDCDMARATARLLPFLAHIDTLYVSVCLDAFPASIAPGVSAPSHLGIAPHFAIELLHWLAAQETRLGYHWPLIDIAEMSPPFDLDGRTAGLAARLIFEATAAKACNENCSA